MQRFGRSQKSYVHSYEDDGSYYLNVGIVEKDIDLIKCSAANFIKRLMKYMDRFSKDFSDDGSSYEFSNKMWGVSFCFSNININRFEVIRNEVIFWLELNLIKEGEEMK